LGTHDKSNLVQATVLQKIVPQGDVSVMNRIKGAKIQTNFFHSIKVGNPLGFYEITYNL
jgi:hypothetical protein